MLWVRLAGWNGSVDNVYTWSYSYNMDIVWDEDKNSWLRINRDISFEEISELILEKRYIDVLENPTREDQLYFVLFIHDYTWIVPFLLQEEELVLKTAFPSRKYHRIYGRRTDD